MKKLILTLFAISSFLSLKAQNLFPNKLDNCKTERFCLDCGDEKASVNPEAFASLIDEINKTTDLGKASGKILLQVLIDSLGNGCVLSHTDNSKSKITQNIISHFNNFKGWIPAKVKEKIEGRVSINMLVEVKDGILTSKIQRVDAVAFKSSFDRPMNPEIFNKYYTYKNEHLKNYTITVWSSKNSPYSDNFNDYLAIDNNNIIWFPIDKGLMQFNGKDFALTEHIVDKQNSKTYYMMATDNQNIKWTIRNDDIYSYNDKIWTIYDQQVLGFKNTYYLFSNAKSGELFFCTKDGLHIYKEGKWSVINNDNTKGLPLSTISFAQRDSKNRLWIGTHGGSIMIDAKGKITRYNDTNTILNGKCITSMDEDENGNLFFGLYEYNRKDKNQVNYNEGIGIYYTNGELKQFTTSNSGMPYNHVTKVLYDKTEKALWIATDRAGLVRFDLKNGWENYHNQNSGIPTSYISNMAFDKNNVLYLTTRQGLVRLQRN
jgi:hypothetical protein